MNGFGITLIGPNFEIISQETFKSNVEENFLEKRLFETVTNVCGWILNKNLPQFIVGREDHNFAQFGRAHGNIQLAGMIDVLCMGNFRLVPGKTYLKVSPRVWMKALSVKKPKRKSKSGSSLIVRQYKEEHPGLGRNENEIDSFYIAKWTRNEYLRTLNSNENQ